MHVFVLVCACVTMCMSAFVRVYVSHGCAYVLACACVCWDSETGRTNKREKF